MCFKSFFFCFELFSLFIFLKNKQIKIYILKQMVISENILKKKQFYEKFLCYHSLTFIGYTQKENILIYVYIYTKSTSTEQ